MIPAQTSPLTKSIRTLEGWLVIAANITLVVVPIVTTSLPPDLSAKIAGGLDAVYVISRAIVKAFATPPATAAEPTPTPAAPLSITENTLPNLDYGLHPGGLDTSEKPTDDPTI